MRHLCVTIGTSRFAVPAADVREVAPAVAARPVPKAPSWCRGFACARGQWLPLVHAAELLGLGRSSPTARSRTLLLECGGNPAQSLLVEVDAVDELVSLAGEGAHPGLSVGGQAWLGPIHSLAGGSVQVLHLAALRQHPAWEGLSAEGAQGGPQ